MPSTWLPPTTHITLTVSPSLPSPSSSTSLTTARAILASRGNIKTLKYALTIGSRTRGKDMRVEMKSFEKEIESRVDIRIRRETVGMGSMVRA